MENKRLEANHIIQLSIDQISDLEDVINKLQSYKGRSWLRMKYIPLNPVTDTSLTNKRNVSEAIELESKIEGTILIDLYFNGVSNGFELLL